MEAPPGSGDPEREEPQATTDGAPVADAGVAEVAEPTAPASGGPTRAELQAARRRPRRLRSRPSSITVLALAVVVLVVAGVALWVRSRLSEAPPGAFLHARVPARLFAGGVAPTLPWTTTGQSAVAIPAVGFAAQSGPEQPVPVASSTKMMTALVVLHDHPLAAGQPGPTITIGPADVADFEHDTVTDQVGIPVATGETWTERQLVEGMLVHSANDFAGILARWDAGSLDAFVAKMNAAAASLGMSQSHFADASGFDQRSVSTAADLLRLASADMQIPAFAQAVRLPSVTLPLVGEEASYTPLVGRYDVVGIKSGFTSAAGGCDVMALRQTVGGHTFVVLTAITGQQGPNVLGATGLEALNISRVAASAVHPVQVATAGQRVADLGSGTGSTPVATVGGASVLAWPGQTIHRRMVATVGTIAGLPRGHQVGRLVVHHGDQHVSTRLRATRRVPSRSLMERLF